MPLAFPGGVVRTTGQSMGLRATVIGHNDAISGNLDTLRLRGPNLNSGYDGNGIQLDDLILNPEPATVVPLGLYLGLVRRKR